VIANRYGAKRSQDFLEILLCLVVSWLFELIKLIADMVHKHFFSGTYCHWMFALLSLSLFIIKVFPWRWLIRKMICFVFLNQVSDRFDTFILRSLLRTCRQFSIGVRC
jgi:hypothetical protein